MDGVEPVPGHGRHLFRENPGGVDDQARIHPAPVGFRREDFPVLNFHFQHRRVQGHLHPVLHGVFSVGDGQPVGADTAGGRIGNGELEARGEFRLPPVELPGGDDLRVRDSVPVFAQQAVERRKGPEPAILKAYILPHPAEGNVQLLADLVIHGIALSDIGVLFRALFQIDAGMDLAVVAAAGLEGQVRLLLHKKNVQLPLAELPGDRGAGNAAANDEHIGPAALQGIIRHLGQAHFLRLRLSADKVVDHMDFAVPLRRQAAGLHHLCPGVHIPREDHRAIPKRRGHPAGKPLFQPMVDFP